MNLDSRIFVAGHRGLVGSAVVRELQRQGFQNILMKVRSDLDLTRQAAVDRFYEEARPEYVILAAARVGGILANDTSPAQFLTDNLQIQTNVIDAAWRFGVRKLLFLGSSCVYPKHAAQPMREDCLLTGPLEPTSQWYAVAKIAGIKMCEAYRRQYQCDFITAMPATVYGPNDNYDPKSSHVLPALIRRFHEAKKAGIPKVTCWGTGSPRREFLYVDDLAAACVFLMQRYSDEQFINLGSGIEVSIRELTELVRDTVGYAGEIFWDSSKPDGMPRKLVDNSRLAAMGWKPAMALTEGLQLAYQDFLNRYS